MRVRYVFLTAIMAVFLVGSAAAIGCGGDGESDDDASSDDGTGRIVVPTVDWESAGDGEENGGSEDTEEEIDPPTQPSGSNGDESPADEDSSGEITLRGERIDLRLTVNGQEHPLEMPIFVHDGDLIECEFHVTTFGSKLKHYRIDNSAIVSVPAQGSLSGNQATIPYQVTYVARTWGDGRITFTVISSRGTVREWQIAVMEPGDSGFRGH